MVNSILLVLTYIDLVNAMNVQGAVPGGVLGKPDVGESICSESQGRSGGPLDGKTHPARNPQTSMCQSNDG